MCRRFLSLLSLLISLPDLANAEPRLPAAWEESHYGTCFESISDGMKTVYGVDYEADENIFQQEVTYGDDQILLTGDRTSGTNSSRTIFEGRAGGSWCVVLTSPPVASLSPVSQRSMTAKPIRWKTSTQASPGYPETHVIYVWSQASRIYKPSQCYLVLGGKRQNISCSNAYR
jgi:hypothetical protein